MTKLFIILFFLFTNIFSREQDKVEHILEGNLALPTSQQPGPLFCFGQTVIDKGDLQGYIFADKLWNKNSSFSDLLPYFIYGIRDNLALTVGLPFAVKFRDHNFCSSGIEDLYAQLEYAFYNKDCSSYANQATFVTAISFPTGSTKKIPETGLGSPTFFFGFTINHMATDWYVFGSPGIIFTTGEAKKELGEIFLYEFGIGRNINYISSKRIVTLILEFFGATSTKKNSSASTFVINKNLISSGFYIGPSLWISTQKFIFNTGIAFLASRNTKNSADNVNYFFAAEIGYKFN